MFLSSVGLLCIIVMLIRMVRLPASNTIFADREVFDQGLLTHGLWPTLAWFGFLLILTSLFGFILALVVFLMAFMRFRAGLSWVATSIYSASGILFMMAMAWILNRDFPPGLLQEYVNLPWPLT